MNDDEDDFITQLRQKEARKEALSQALTFALLLMIAVLSIVLMIQMDRAYVRFLLNIPIGHAP